LVNTVAKAVVGIVSARRVRAVARVLAGPAVIAASLAGWASAPGPAASPRWEVSPLHRGPHNTIVRVVTERRLVALTFDDGPSARYTPAILRRLRAARARATFFMVGESALREPGIVRAAVRAGHEIGNHTLDHARLPDLSSVAIASKLRAGARALERAGAPPPRYALPPWGHFDDRVGELAARVRPGSIILAHDGRGTRDRTVAALPTLIARLRERGFELVTVSKLMRAAERGSGPDT